MHFLAGYAALLDYRYWINPRPIPLGPTLVDSIVAFFGWFLLASIVLYFVSRHVRKNDRLMEDVVRRFARLMLLTAFLGYLFLFFAYEQIPLLGMRFWFLLLFFVFSFWLVRAIVFAVRDYPEIRQHEADRLRFKKYLPNAS
ncbi:MAG: hypothetical protein V1738_03980 [Patescibacteria group bacterium]